MPKQHIIRDNEWLLKIAHQYGFRNVTAILDANPGLEKLCAGNFDVLPRSHTISIPARVPKYASAKTGEIHKFQAAKLTKYLHLTFQDSKVDPSEKTRGMPLAGWSYAMTINDKTKYGQTADDGGVTWDEDIPDSIQSAQISLENKRKCKVSVKLIIGGLAPIIGDSVNERCVAVQKILTNLGYYRGKIDGDLEKSDSWAAVRTFQKAVDLFRTGAADPATCHKLLATQKNVMAAPVAPQASTKLTRDFPLASDQEVPDNAELGHIDDVKVTPEFVYTDPTAYYPNNRQPLNASGPLSLPAQTAFVAPCEPGKENENPNVIRLAPCKFIFLDVGRWLKDARDFGLIWGRHVYLCEYKPKGDAIRFGQTRAGLDQQFFIAMNREVDKVQVNKVQVNKLATADWESEDTIDWHTLYVVIPDMHLMTSGVADTWRKPFGLQYDLQPEIDFLKFAQDLVSIGFPSDTVRFVQIGDSYDLWVGYGVGEKKNQPLFEARRKEQVVELTSPPKKAVDILCQWIREIQGDGPLGWTDRNWVKEVFCERAKYQEKREEYPFNENAYLDYYEKLLDCDADAYKKLSGIEYNPSLKSTLWRNPVDVAFSLLERAFKATYIYGNHDNYLGLEEVCIAAHMRKRYRCFQDIGIFIEHGHRMEAWFTDFGGGWYAPPLNILIKLGLEERPLNCDGNPTGYEATIGVYNAIKANELVPTAGEFVYETKLDQKEARVHDQPFYYEEAARWWIWLYSRQATPPHTFIIGHTHEPNLFYINIMPWPVGAVEDTHTKK